MNNSITSINHDTPSGYPELVVNKEPLINHASALYSWIMDTEERLIIDTLLKHGGIDSIKRLHGVLGNALEENEIVKDAGMVRKF